MVNTGEGSALDRTVADLEAGLASHVDAGEVVGLTWLVGSGGDVRAGAMGHGDVAGSQPVATDTIFRISSMSKPVTATAALMLVEDGTFGLDDPVDGWLPELAGRRVLAHPTAVANLEIGAGPPAPHCHQNPTNGFGDSARCRCSSSPVSAGSTTRAPTSSAC